MADSTVPVPVSPAPPPVARPGALVLGQSGFEDLLVRELTDGGGKVLGKGGGWVHVEGIDPAAEWCFAHTVLRDPVEVTGDSVNQLAGRLADWFLAAIRT